MKKILFLTTRLPFPPQGGERLRPYHFIKQLSKEYKIKVIAFIESVRDLERAKGFSLENVETRTVHLPKHVSYLNCVRGLFSAVPLQISYYASGCMHQVVSEELRTGGYDLIFCHLLRMAPFVQDAPLLKIVDLCDALSLRYDLASRYRSGLFKVIERVEARRLASYEPHVSSRFDLSVIASTVDRDYLEKNLCMKGIVVVENGVDLECLAPLTRRVDPRKIVFFANLRTFHNVDAVQFFFKDILPLIKKEIPDVKFVVAGAHIPACIRRMDDGCLVAVHSDVADLNTLVSDASLAVAPMRIAVGIQNKIIQAMSLGLPVVTTSIGRGGIPAQDGVNIMVADTPLEFAQKTVALLRDPSLRDAISRRSQALIRERYLWPGIIDNFKNKINEVLNR